MDGGAAELDAEYLRSFEATLYPVLSAACGACHSSETARVWPLIADVDPEVALGDAHGLLSLNTPQASRLVRVVGQEEHGCSTLCERDALEVEMAISELASRAPASLRHSALQPHVDGLPEDELLEAVRRDRESLPEDERPMVRYVSLHQLNNAIDWSALAEPWADIDRLNAARVALSMVLNSLARGAPEVIHPEPIDSAAQIFRLNIADYWGWDVQGLPDPELALATWERITRGNIDTTDEVAQDAATYPNNSGFHADYVDADQLVYTLTRPDVYNAVLQIPEFATELEEQLGVRWDLEPGGAQFLVVPRAATADTRLIGRAPSRDGAYWRTTDPMVGASFIFYQRPIPEFVDPARPSQLITTALYSDGSVDELYSGQAGPQAHCSFVAFTLPNGLLGFSLFGANNQRLPFVLPSMLADPWRWHGRTTEVEDGTLPNTLVGESCLNCHEFGLRGALDTLRPRLGEILEGSELQRAESLYPGQEVMTSQFWSDSSSFLRSRDSVVSVSSPGMLRPSATENGLLVLLQSARDRLGYADTTSN